MNTFRFLWIMILAGIQMVSAQPNAYTRNNPELEVVAALEFRPGNVAVSRQGKVFATIHPLGESKLQLIEVLNNTYKPFPDNPLQKNGASPADDKLDTPLGIVVDKKDRLWVIDMGLQLGKTRLWCFDITKNKVIRKIELPETIAPKGSFIQDLAIDEKNDWAYLADIHTPGIIALDLKTEKARRFGNHPAVQSEDIDMIIDGKVIYFGGAPARVGINPITLSDDRETIYFGAMNGKTWYGVPARLFREGKDDNAISAAIKKVGDKPISDGVRTDRYGNHYFTNLGEHAVAKLDKAGNLTNIIQDGRLNWPDSLDLSADGWVYISVNQLNATPAFTGGADEGKAPYYIYRFRL